MNNPSQEAVDYVLNNPEWAARRMMKQDQVLADADAELARMDDYESRIRQLEKLLSIFKAAADPGKLDTVSIARINREHGNAKT